MSFNLRIVGAFVALGLSLTPVSGQPALPTIVVSDPAPAESARVMFARPATPAEAPVPPAPLRLAIAGANSAADQSPASAAVQANASASVVFSTAAGRTLTAAPVLPPAAMSTRSDTPVARDAPPVVSFSAPQYEPASPAPRYEATQTERETIAACLVLEAASQGDFGMRAVMAVIRNRARGEPELFAPTALQPMQFSALNKVTTGRESLRSAINRAKRDRVWPVALAIVDDSLHDTWHDPTGGATHYTRSAEQTRWTRRLAKTTTIGAHSFYR